MEPAAPPSAVSRALTALTYLLLFVLGGGLGLLGAFLVPERVFGVPGIALVVAVVGNIAAGLLGGWGLRNRPAAGVSGLGWLAAALAAGTGRAEGDLLVPGSLPADPAIGVVGSLFLFIGVVAAAVPLGLVGRRRGDQP